MRKKTLRALIDDVAKLLQKHVRLKAAVAADKNGFIECVSCGKWYRWKDMQGGHWIERGKQLRLWRRTSILNVLGVTNTVCGIGLTLEKGILST